MSVDAIFTLTKDSKIPLGLQRVLMDTIKCTICMAVPIRPPIIITKCCKNMLGCETCTNKWFSGPDALIKPCPLCNCERGYNETMVLRGFDNFLNEISKLRLGKYDTEDSDSDSDLPVVNL